MSLPRLTTLSSVPAAERPDLVAPPVAEVLAGWPPASEVAAVEIDPELADTAAMSDAYDVPLAWSGNCVVVAGRRAGEERVAACVVPATTRADVNTSGGRGDRHGVRRDHPGRAPRGLAAAGRAPRRRGRGRARRPGGLTGPTRSLRGR